ncbi:hypothetical protein [Terriglobus sp.]|uniref:hypothetical protein n=1 Tax=Terriglobus sp. TaxID=1889013 RepID=UPI003B00FD72
MARNRQQTSEAVALPRASVERIFIIMKPMEQNSIVVMLDEEISRLRQVRTILQSLVAVEARVAPLLVVAAVPEPVEEERPEASSVVRHVSRRGIKTGRRGPRAKEAAAPRPLDTAVPKAPVVVSRSALTATKPVAAPTQGPPPDGTLEALVRSFKQAQPAA